MGNPGAWYIFRISFHVISTQHWILEIAGFRPQLLETHVLPYPTLAEDKEIKHGWLGHIL